MRILVDATSWEPGRSGVGVYTERVLRALVALGEGDELLFATNRATHAIDLPGRVLVQRFPVRGLWVQAHMAWNGIRHAPDVAFYPNFLGPLIPSAPMVVTFHDMSVFLAPQTVRRGKALLQRRLLPAVAARAAAILTPSEASRRDVIRILGVPAGKVVTTTLAMDEGYLAPPDPEAIRAVRQRHGIPARYLLAVGTLEPRKNLVRLVRAFERARASAPEVGLVLVGGKGWRDAALRKVLDESPARGSIHATGYVDEGDLRPLYQGAVALCFTSLHEGFGLPVVEAMAAGTPVLVSVGGALDEVAGGAGLTVDPLDVEAIASGIRRLLTEPRLRDELARAGRARASTLSWQRTARLTRQVLERVAAGLPPGGGPAEPLTPPDTPPPSPARIAPR